MGKTKITVNKKPKDVTGNEYNHEINLWKLFGIIMLIAFGVPLLLSLGLKIPWFSLASGQVEGWLGFWGSFLGGILGAIGVVVTTFLIINSNNKITLKSIRIQDIQSRERDYTFYEIQKIEEVQVLYIKYNNVVYKNFNILRFIVTQLEDMMRFNQAKQIVGKDEKEIEKLLTPKDYQDRNSLITEYNNLRDQEVNLRFEMVEIFDTLESKVIIFPELREEIQKIKKEIESVYIDLKDINKGNSESMQETINTFIEKNEIRRNRFRGKLVKVANSKISAFKKENSE